MQIWPGVFRKMQKQKGYIAASVLCLTMGLVCSVLIGLYVRSELMFESHHKNMDRIFRVIREWDFPNETLWVAVTSAHESPALKADFPDEIEDSARIYHWRDEIFEFQGKSINNELAFVDPALTNIFTWKFIEGNPDQVLAEPNTLILSRSVAQKIFGDRSAVGRVIRVGEFGDLRVDGVFEDPPETTHLQMTAMASFLTHDPNLHGDWGVGNYYTFVLLNQPNRALELEAKFPEFVARYADKDRVDNIKLHLQPLRDIRLRSTLTADMAPTGSMSVIYLLISIIGLILTLSCLNFINLSTAMCSARASEFGVRQAFGAHRSSLSVRFVIESIGLGVFSGIFALGVCALVLPPYGALLGRQFHLSDIQDMWSLLCMAGLPILVGLAGGLLPAISLAKTRPIDVLRPVPTGATINSGGARKAMVVFQFAVTAVLLVGLTAIARQIAFVQNRDLGYASAHMVIVPVTFSEVQFQSLRNELTKFPRILGVTASSGLPGEKIARDGFRLDVSWYTRKVLPTLRVAPNFADLYELSFITGSSFKTTPGPKSEEYILNQQAVKAFGWPSAEEAIGQELDHFVVGRRGQIVGVVQDFHFRSFHHAIEPLVLTSHPRHRRLSIKIANEQVSTTLSDIEGALKEILPNYPFEYYFLDENVQKMYQAEHKLLMLAKLGSVVAVGIALVGLFSFSAFMVLKNRKPVAIRRVCGARLFHIMSLLTGEYVKLILLANVIGIPIGAFLVEQWKASWAQTPGLFWGDYVGVCVLSLALGLITVAYHIFSTVQTNPVDVLKAE